MGLPAKPIKIVNFYRQTELALWQRATKTVREKYDAENAAEGTVTAQVAAEALNETGPLEGGENA